MSLDAVLLDPYITRTLMRDLVGHDRKPAAFLVYLWLVSEEARTAADVQVSYAALAEETGLSRSAAQSAVSWLWHRKLLTAEHSTVTATPVYRTLRPWKRRKPPLQ